MVNIDAVSDEKIESASEPIQPAGDKSIDTKHKLQLAGISSRSKSSNIRQDKGLLDVDFCHSSLSTQPIYSDIDTSYDEHGLHPARLSSRAKPTSVKSVSQLIFDHQVGI